jgi:hypothetical protein
MREQLAILPAKELEQIHTAALALAEASEPIATIGEK